MAKKKHDRQLSKRFNGSDIDKWQELANKETGGNLTLLIELTMNKAVERAAVSPLNISDNERYLRFFRE